MFAHASPAQHAAVVIVGGAAAGVYAVAWWRLGRHSSAWRLWAWMVGIAALLVSVTPAVERRAEATFTAHMVQHLVMILVAAPLLVLARPVRTIGDGLLHRRPARHERHVARWWRRFGAVIAPAMFIGVLFVTHLTAIYDDALSTQWLHDLEHAAYLGAAVALWAVALSPGRSAAVGRVGMVFAVIAGSAFLGIILLTASVPLVDTYAEALGVDGALDDQRAAASLMWVSGMALTLPLLITSVWRWASSEQRDAERGEALADRTSARPVTSVTRG